MRNALNGKLRMGAMPSMSPILPLLLQMVRERHPGVMVDVQFIGNEAMKTCLNNFSIDVALTYLETADLGRRNTLPVYSERLSLLVPDTDEFRGRQAITWREAAALPLAMLRPSLHERRFVDQVFASVDCRPEAKVESESILHLMFQVQFTELCTIVPSHFEHMPGLHPGTRMLELVEPSVSQEVGLFWAEGETMMPMTRALVGVVKALNKSGALKAQLGEPASAKDFTKARDARAALGMKKETSRKAARPAV